MRQDSLPEVVVTGARQQIDIRHLSQTVSVVDSASIARSQQSSLLPILTEQVPGLFTTARGVMGYGVSGGGSGAIAVRGLSGSTGQLMVLIDGHPQYMGLMGHPIADTYLSHTAERMEVLRGPASVIYGSNAMGGVVNIITRRQQADGVQTRLRAGYGAYNTLETEVSNEVQMKGVRSVVSASYNRTDGHRENMGFEQYGGYAKIGYAFSPAWDIAADINITHFNASQPGSVSQPLEDADQRITRGVTSLTLTNTYTRTSGALSGFYNFGHHYINDGYTPDTTDTNTPKAYRFDSRDFMAGVSAYQSVQLFRGNRLTVGVDYFAFGGKARNLFVEGAREGEADTLINTVVHEVAAYLDFRQHITDWVTINAGVRADYHSLTGVEWVPQAGIAIHLPQAAELKLSAAKGYRNPTLREMYLFPPQNPDLRPESLWNYELSVAQQLLQGRLTYGLNLFYIDGKNIILSLPNPNGAGMLNQNAGKVNNCGVEAEITGLVGRGWRLHANYSFLHMQRPVAGAPEHKLYAGVQYAEGRWEVSTGVQYIHGLYTSTSPVEQQHFVLWNLRGRVQVLRWLSLWVRGENLLAQRYEINAGYPMPLATAMGGIEIVF
ncbi:MAG: TonB-dependent receptor [Paludibacteraceae bacterium]